MASIVGNRTTKCNNERITVVDPVLKHGSVSVFDVPVAVVAVGAVGAAAGPA
jgi:hypothetical protein